MSDIKKYYYLKLKENFFDNEEQKILESQVNGMEYQNLYLKLCLLSVKNDGCLIFKDRIPYEPKMLATVLRVNIDTVKTGIELFVEMGLMTVSETGKMYMDDIQSLIGHGSDEAERKAQYRLKLEDKSGTKSGQSLPELSKRQDKLSKDKYKTSIQQKRKYKFYENVLLTYEQYKKLKADFGRNNLKKAIEKLDYYISTSKKGKAYTDHYSVFKKGGWLYEQFGPNTKNIIKEDYENMRLPT